MKTRHLCALVLLAIASLGSLNVSAKASADRTRIEHIFAAHDRLQPGLDEYMRSVAADVILMPNGGAAIEGKPAYLQHVRDFYASGKIQIRHEVIEVYSYPEVVIARGRAVGEFTPPDGSRTTTFETKNMFVFRRLKNGNLEVWQIIFNDSPQPSH